MTTTGVRLARAEDVPTLAEVLALAFDSDPVTRWHVPEDARRVPLMTRFFAFALESIFLPLGAVWTSEDRSGAAVWMPHQAHDAPPTPPDPSGSSIDEIFGDDAWMVETIIGLQEEHRPREPHHYLQFMGTRPDRQGQGIGTALMIAGLARCDDDGLPAFLDASSTASRDFYQHHGFRVVDTFDLPNGPRFWQMRYPADAGERVTSLIAHIDGVLG